MKIAGTTKHNVRHRHAPQKHRDPPEKRDAPCGETARKRQAQLLVKEPVVGPFAFEDLLEDIHHTLREQLQGT